MIGFQPHHQEVPSAQPGVTVYAGSSFGEAPADVVVALGARRGFPPAQPRQPRVGLREAFNGQFALSTAAISAPAAVSTSSR
ncbi:hypothetical protein [Cryptosporangium sp. NPDC048952]|uniref:hypothetical protein n=1 Tax=Cryptosporangium sp. NPDC048952 TaxID=3363961 RepID=UPI0037157FB9